MKTSTLLGSILLSGFCFMLSTSCSSMRSRASGYSKDDGVKRESEPGPRNEVPEEYSLKEDRDGLDKLRKDEPDDVKRENDEFAFIMKMMGEVRERPERVRERWDTEYRRRRDKFNTMNSKDREKFNAEEKKKRDLFMRESDKERDHFSNGKHTAEERREFYNEHETKRREFFAKQNDLRKDFESDLKQRISDFDAYMKEKSTDFNYEWRAYSDRFRQYEKEKRDFEEAKRKHEKQKKLEAAKAAESTESNESAGAPAQTGASAIKKSVRDDYKDDLDAFNKIPKGPADKLGSGDGK